MTKYVSPREFYQTYQPHGDKATLYISDTLRGGRFANVDKVTHEDDTYFIHVEGSKVAWDGYLELIVKETRAGDPVFQPLFTWLLDSSIQDDLISYNGTLQDHFSDSYELNRITMASTLQRIRDACDGYNVNGKAEDDIGQRVSMIKDLAYVMSDVDLGEYDRVVSTLEDLLQRAHALRREAKNLVS